jgi:peptide/nickel transport system substrate-binding protein
MPSGITSTTPRRLGPPSGPRRAALLSCAAAAALVLGLAACSASGTDAGSSAVSSSRAKTLIIADDEPPASFDPVQADNSTVDEVDLPAYDTLVKYDGSGKLVSDLATAWKVSADGLSVSMTLRGNATFHDGAAVTATDVKYTLDRVKKIGTGVATLVAPYQSATVTSPTQLTIHLSSPYAPFLAALTRIYILNAALVQQHAGSDEGQSWLATHDAGSGPYELKSYTPNQQAQFSEYPKYWGGFSGQAASVVFKYMTAGAEETSALRNGSIDLAMNVDSTDWASFASNPKFVVDKANSNVMLYVFFKMAGAPTANKYLREAVSYAYDYQQHVSDILKGAGQTATGVTPSGMACYDASIPQPAYDIAKARQLLAESGLKNVTLTLTYLSSTPEMQQAATLLQSDLKQIGVTLKLEAITYPQYAQMETKTATTPEMGMIYAFPAYPDPDSILDQNFDSKFINGGQNWGDFVSPAVNKLVEKAQTLTSMSQRCVLYNQAEKLVVADTPTINMSNPQYVTVYSSRLSGYRYEVNHNKAVDVYLVKVK